MPKFRPYERIKSRKLIAGIFQHRDNTAGIYPLRLKWMRLKTPRPGSPVMFSVSVPKKAFPHATDRNRIRRQIRESWRLQKDGLYTKLTAADPAGQWAIMCLYVAKEATPYDQIDRAMSRLLKKIPDQLVGTPPVS